MCLPAVSARHPLLLVPPSRPGGRFAWYQPGHVCDCAVTVTIIPLLEWIGADDDGRASGAHRCVCQARVRSGLKEDRRPSRATGRRRRELPGSPDPPRSARSRRPRRSPRPGPAPGVGAPIDLHDGRRQGHAPGPGRSAAQAAELVGVFGVAREAGDADAQGEPAERHVVFVAELHALDGRAQALGDQDGAGLEGRRVGQQDSRTRRRRDGRRCRPCGAGWRKAACDRLEHRVAGHLATIERRTRRSVYADQHDRERLLVAARAGRLGVEPLVEVPAIEEAGDGVDRGLAAEAATEARIAPARRRRGRRAPAGPRARRASGAAGDGRGSRGSRAGSPATTSGTTSRVGSPAVRAWVGRRCSSARRTSPSAGDPAWAAPGRGQPERRLAATRPASRRSRRVLSRRQPARRRPPRARTSRSRCAARPRPGGRSPAEAAPPARERRPASPRDRAHRPARGPTRAEP